VVSFASPVSRSPDLPITRDHPIWLLSPSASSVPLRFKGVGLLARDSRRQTRNQPLLWIRATMRFLAADPEIYEQLWLVFWHF
jgi:hypothetical protein